MKEFLTQSFYHNSIQDWALALVTLAATLVVAKAVYWLLSRTLKRLSALSPSSRLGLFADIIEEPMVFSLVVAGFWLSVNSL